MLPGQVFEQATAVIVMSHVAHSQMLLVVFGREGCHHLHHNWPCHDGKMQQGFMRLGFPWACFHRPWPLNGLVPGAPPADADVREEA